MAMVALTHPHTKALYKKIGFKQVRCFNKHTLLSQKKVSAKFLLPARQDF